MKCTSIKISCCKSSVLSMSPTVLLPVCFHFPCFIIHRLEYSKSDKNQMASSPPIKGNTCSGFMRLQREILDTMSIKLGVRFHLR